MAPNRQRCAIGQALVTYDLLLIDQHWPQHRNTVNIAALLGPKSWCRWPAGSTATPALRTAPISTHHPSGCAATSSRQTTDGNHYPLNVRLDSDGSTIGITPAGVTTTNRRYHKETIIDPAALVLQHHRHQSTAKPTAAQRQPGTC